MRLFVALYPSAAAVESLAAAVPPLPPPQQPQWRLVPIEQWHLTLAFLGEVAESRVTELAQRLARAAGRSGPLALALAGGGAFPSASRARVLWVGVAGDRDGLVRLAERAAAAARRSGVPLENRRYRPHVTLARSRAPQGADATRFVDALWGYCGPREPVTEIVLVRSVVGSTVRHEQIGRWPLGT